MPIPIPSPRGLVIDEATLWDALLHPAIPHKTSLSPPSNLTITLPTYPPSGSPASPPAYVLAPDSTGGLGLFATRAISPGEVVLSESPLFHPARTLADVEAGLARLDERGRAIFWSFTDVHNPTSPIAMTIISTNGVPLGDGTGDGGLFPFISRINHSCLPNVYWRYDHKAKQMAVVAIGDIPEGAEILVSYIPLSHTRQQRMHALKHRFKFTCACAACAVPDPESDRRRERNAAIPDLLEEAGNDDDLVGGLRMLKERIRLKDEEGLNDLYERTYDYHEAFEVGIMCYDYDTARRYMKLAYAFAVLAFGPHDIRTRSMLVLCSNPDSHPSTGSAGRVLKLPEICDGCDREAMGGFKGPGSKGGTCGDCHAAVYCSKKCKVAHVPRHRAACAVLKKSKGLTGGK